jgi:transcriptional regulator with XRE-family HTH domain
MTEFATRLRAAARRLSLSDGEIARRLGISQQRFTHYANGTRKPDFSMLVKICQVLAVTPNDLLGFSGAQELTPVAVLRDRIAAAAGSMNESALKRAAAVMDTLAAEEETAD